MTTPIRYTTEDNRTAAQTTADEQVREEVERTDGAWAQMTDEQREQLRARVQEKKLARRSRTRT